MKSFAGNSKAAHRLLDCGSRDVYAAVMHPVPSGPVRRQIAEVLNQERIFFDTAVGATHG